MTCLGAKRSEFLMSAMGRKRTLARLGNERPLTGTGLNPGNDRDGRKADVATLPYQCVVPRTPGGFPKITGALNSNFGHFVHISMREAELLLCHSRLRPAKCRELGRSRLRLSLAQFYPVLLREGLRFTPAILKSAGSSAER